MFALEKTLDPFPFQNIALRVVTICNIMLFIYLTNLSMRSIPKNLCLKAFSYRQFTCSPLFPDCLHYILPVLHYVLLILPRVPYSITTTDHFGVAHTCTTSGHLPPTVNELSSGRKASFSTNVQKEKQSISRLVIIVTRMLFSQRPITCFLV